MIPEPPKHTSSTCLWAQDEGEEEDHAAGCGQDQLEPEAEPPPPSAGLGRKREPFACALYLGFRNKTSVGRFYCSV